MWLYNVDDGIPRDFQVKDTWGYHLGQSNMTFSLKCYFPAHDLPPVKPKLRENNYIDTIVSWFVAATGCSDVSTQQTGKLIKIRRFFPVQKNFLFSWRDKTIYQFLCTMAMLLTEFFLLLMFLLHKEKHYLMFSFGSSMVQVHMPQHSWLPVSFLKDLSQKRKWYASAAFSKGVKKGEWKPSNCTYLLK